MTQTARGLLLAEWRSVVTDCSLSKHIECQTDVRDTFDPQRFSGAVSNHRRPLVPAAAFAYLSFGRESDIIRAYKTGAHVMSNQVIERKPNGQFAKGSSGNLGGNAQRSRHALNADTIREMHLAFRRGGPKAIETLMRTQPAVFLKLFVLLVPREMKMEHSGRVKGMTEEQIVDAIE